MKCISIVAATALCLSATNTWSAEIISETGGSIFGNTCIGLGCFLSLWDPEPRP